MSVRRKPFKILIELEQNRQNRQAELCGSVMLNSGTVADRACHLKMRGDWKIDRTAQARRSIGNRLWRRHHGRVKTQRSEVPPLSAPRSNRPKSHQPIPFLSSFCLFSFFFRCRSSFFYSLSQKIYLVVYRVYGADPAENAFIRIWAPKAHFMATRQVVDVQCKNFSTLVPNFLGKILLPPVDSLA